MKTKIAGRYLWAVKTSGRDEPDNYWITTRRNRAVDAIVKANAFFKKTFGFVKHVREVTSRGTIDA